MSRPIPLDLSPDGRPLRVAAPLTAEAAQRVADAA